MKNILWNTVGGIFYCVCQWLITILVVWFGSYEAAGYLSFAMTMSSSFSAIALFSMRNYQVSDVKGKYTVNEYVGSRIITCFFALVLCIAFLDWRNAWYQGLCVTAFMLVRLAEASVDVLHGVNQKYCRYDLIGKSYLIRGMLTILSFVIGMMTMQDLFAALILMAICNLFAVVLYDWMHTNKLISIHPEVFQKRILKLLRQCVPIVFFSFLLSLENLIPKSVLQQLCGTDILGVYASIASPTLIVQVFANVAFNPLLPRLSMLYQEHRYEDFLHFLHKIYAALAALSGIALIGAILIGKWWLALLFGGSILKYYSLFFPIVWCTILTAMIWVLSSIFIAIREIKLLVIGMAADFMLCLSLVTNCIRHLGANGASVVQIIVYGVYILFLVATCEMILRRRKKQLPQKTKEKCINEETCNHSCL